MLTVSLQLKTLPKHSMDEGQKKGRGDGPLFAQRDFGISKDFYLGIRASLVPLRLP
jgi:hypothetical protein